MSAWADIERAALAREAEIEAIRKAEEESKVAALRARADEVLARKLEEHNRKKAILDSYNVEAVLTDLAEKWGGGEVVSIEQHRSHNAGHQLVEGWALHSKGYQVPVLHGGGKDLELRLVGQRSAIEVVVTETLGETPSKVEIRDRNIYKLDDAREHPLSDLVIARGLETGLTEAITDRRLGERQFFAEVKTDSYADFALVMRRKALNREVMKSLPNDISEWTQWITGQLPDLNEQQRVDKKELRAWGHTQRGNRGLTRFVDRIVPFSFKL